MLWWRKLKGKLVNLLSEEIIHNNELQGLVLMYNIGCYTPKKKQQQACMSKSKSFNGVNNITDKLRKCEVVLLLAIFLGICKEATLTNE